jgi:serine/threonine protein kinase
MGQFTFVKRLCEAPRNCGHVDDWEIVATDRSVKRVAIKCMPNYWVTDGPEEFKVGHPKAVEQPWVDVAVTRLLEARGCKHICQLLEILRDAEMTFVVSALAPLGDLVAWSRRRPWSVSEEITLPVVQQIFDAVLILHEHGVAHRDLSLENILLREEKDGVQKVEIIDYGMATLSRTGRGRKYFGKSPSQAPEMHFDGLYDNFLADSFALGVLVYTMSVGEYPWKSTKPGKCNLFELHKGLGLVGFLQTRRFAGQGDLRKLIEVLSPSLVELLAGLLEIEPAQRLSLGESCFACPDGRSAEMSLHSARSSVWEMPWLRARDTMCNANRQRSASGCVGGG